MAFEFDSADELLLGWASRHVGEQVVEVSVEHSPGAQIGDYTWDSSYTIITAKLPAGRSVSLNVDLPEIIKGMGDLHREMVKNPQEWVQAK